MRSRYSKTDVMTFCMHLICVYSSVRYIVVGSEITRENASFFPPFALM